MIWLAATRNFNICPVTTEEIGKQLLKLVSGVDEDIDIDI